MATSDPTRIYTRLTDATGESDPERLTDKVRTRIRASRAQVVEALRGRMSGHQRLLLRIHLRQIDAIDVAIAELDEQLGERLEPLRAAIERLITMPGVSTLSAAVIVAEIGVDMTRFPTAAHLISWAGLCPQERRERGQTPLNQAP